MRKMKQIKAYDIETKNARFVLTIYEKNDSTGFVGDYSGTTPKFAQAMPSGAGVPIMQEIGEGSITDSDIEQVETKCREAIKEIDGEIFEERECNI